jgi:hypothetical protein
MGLAVTEAGTPFAFPDRRRLCNGHKQRWRGGPEAVTYSTSFIPAESFRAFAMEMLALR